MSERGISFEDVVFSFQSERLFDDLVHSNKNKYQNQGMLVVEIDTYARLVPYVKSTIEIFLKSIILDRKATEN